MFRGCQSPHGGSKPVYRRALLPQALCRHAPLIRALKRAGGRPILKSQWADGIDTVGGDILTTTIRSTKYGAAVTCCGNVASADLPLNVYPFILRGVKLIGIDSQNCPMPLRLEI